MKKTARETRVREASENAKNDKAKRTAGSEQIWDLRLYVAGQWPKSLAAFANLKKICEERLIGKYNIEVVDVLKNPQDGRGDRIIAIPTLVRKTPLPVKKITGNLSNMDRVIAVLDIAAP